MSKKVCLLLAVIVLFINVGYAKDGNLARELSKLKTNAKSNSTYTIVLAKNESSRQITLDKDTLNNADNVTISLKSVANARVKLKGNGALFTIDEGVTLILENITLEGTRNNNDALIVILEGGSLEIRDGTKITGNENRQEGEDAHGGGIYVDGVLTMSGGEISHNKAISKSRGTNACAYGGGVFVNGGSFTLSGGKIFDNYVTSESDYDDFAKTYGGGVALFGDDAVCTMSGGEITDNVAQVKARVFTSTKAVSFGGGVYIHSAKFSIQGGKIGHNRAFASSITDALAAGGGVALFGGLFTMSGGEISGNSVEAAAASTDVDAFGGGVLLQAAFVKTGGVIYGFDVDDTKQNTVLMSGRIMNDRGSALYSFIQKHRENRETTITND